ncbi:chromosome partitioning protein ParA [Bacteroidia bacterium]|nr:chromosome partitioning protein ParA [Bacteroidia bacterium]
MTEEHNTFDTREEDSQINLSDIIHIVRTNWYWFVLSIGVCCGIAAIYLLWAPKEYSRTASVLIKDDKKGGGGISESAAFEDLTMFSTKRNVDNEVIVFQSEQMMTSVAKRLHLDISYTIRKGLRTVELYTHSPIIVQFFDVEDTQEFSLEATPVSDKEFLLSDFSDSKETITATLNDTIITPVGKALVTSSLFFDEEDYNVPIKVTKSNLTDVIRNYREALQVSLASKTATIINLTLKDHNISRVDDVLNTLIAVYNEAAINDKNQITVNTSNFIAERLIIIEKELGHVDSDIEAFKRENRLTDLQSETGMFLQESSKYSQNQLSLINQKQLAQYIRDYLVNPIRISELIPANTGITDVNIESQIAEYNTALIKRDRLLANSSNKNPVVMDLNNSLNAMRQSIIRAVDNLIVGIDVQIKNVQERDNQNTRRISALPGQQKQVLSIERQQKIKEELYLYLLNKREENELTQAITESNARIIDPATGRNIPVAPKSSIIMLAALILGIVIPAGIFWGHEMLNTSVRNRKDVEDNLSIPLLGDIPLKIHKKGKDTAKEKGIVIRESGRDSVSEAFRIIRTNMDFMQVKADNMQVVQFISLNPGSGKTFISMNLAMSIAMTHKKVILLDLDLRKHTLSSFVQKEENTFGMSNYLSAHTMDYHTLINKKLLNDSDQLDIICAGPIPPNPAELLLSDRLDNLIESLRREYDYIFLDNVPAGLVADASIVNRVVDLTLYVIRAGVFDKRQLPDLERLYRNEKFKNMAVILNAVDYESGYGQYGYGHQYGYSYGYGYGGKHESQF